MLAVRMKVLMMMIPYILQALNRGRGIRGTQIGKSPNKVKATTLNDDLAWVAWSGWNKTGDNDDDRDDDHHHHDDHDLM